MTNKKFKFYALWLSLICILMFILQNIFSEFTDLMLLNQNFSLQFWRYLTSIFVHGSLPHLMFNLFALALFGSILEKLNGSNRFLLVFFFSGLIANIIAINFYPASLGASGAIYGILGALTIIRPGMYVWAFGFPMPMFLAAIFWIAGGVLGLFMPSNTGHIAHLSGIVIGFILGIFYKMNISKRKQNQKIEISDSKIHNWENSYMLKR